MHKSWLLFVCCISRELRFFYGFLFSMREFVSHGGRSAIDRYCSRLLCGEPTRTCIGSRGQSYDLRYYFVIAYRCRCFAAAPKRRSHSPIVRGRKHQRDNGFVFLFGEHGSDKIACRRRCCDSNVEFKLFQIVTTYDNTTNHMHRNVR